MFSTYNESSKMKLGQQILSRALVRACMELNCVAFVLPINPFAAGHLLGNCIGKPRELTCKTQTSGPAQGYILSGSDIIPKTQVISIDGLSVLADERGFPFTSDVDVLYLAHTKHEEYQLTGKYGFARPSDQKFIETLNDEFHRLALSINPTRIRSDVCRHGPFAGLTTLGSNVIRFPLTMVHKKGVEVITGSDDLSCTSAERLRNIIHNLQLEGFAASWPNHWSV